MPTMNSEQISASSYVPGIQNATRAECFEDAPRNPEAIIEKIRRNDPPSRVVYESPKSPRYHTPEVGEVSFAIEKRHSH